MEKNKNSFRIIQTAPASRILLPSMIKLDCQDLNVHLDSALAGWILEEARRQLPSEAMCILFGKIYRVGKKTEIFIERAENISD